jgi:multisubunit Na+/H+ antiporter MnhF subunit
MIALVAFAGVAVALVAPLVRLFAGPALHDRALAAKNVAVHAALLMACAAALSGSPALADAAIALYLGAAVLSLAILKFFRTRAYQPPLASEGDA